MTEAKRKKCFWAAMLALCLMKYLIYGFAYYPQLDDYIQYWAYPNAGNIWTDVVMALGLYNAHPISGIADPYIWGQLWECMWLALIIITLMHFVSAYIFSACLEKCGFAAGSAFAVVYLLLPMGAEAAYWISASSRLVVGMFFVSLSLWCYIKYLQKQKGYWIVLFALLGLISFGFYEQIVIVGFLLSLLLVWRTRRECGAKYIILVPVINLVITGVYYLLFSGSGEFGGRSTLVELGALASHIRVMFISLCATWQRGLLILNYNGLIRGARVLGDNLWYIPILLLGLSCMAWFTPHGAEKPAKSALWVSVILFFAPVSIFFVLADSAIAFRGAFPSFVALGLAAAFLFDIAVKKIWVRRGIVFVIAALCMVVNISEYTDYRNNYECDKKICTNIVSALDEAGYDGTQEVVLLGAQWHYTEQNAYHYSHIYSLAQSDWSLTGGVRFYADDMGIGMITPVQEVPQDTENMIVLSIDQQMKVDVLSQ